MEPLEKTGPAAIFALECSLVRENLVQALSFHYSDEKYISSSFENSHFPQVVTGIT